MLINFSMTFGYCYITLDFHSQHRLWTSWDECSVSTWCCRHHGRSF